MPILARGFTGLSACCSLEKKLGKIMCTSNVSTCFNGNYLFGYVHCPAVGQLPESHFKGLLIGNMHPKLSVFASVLCAEHRNKDLR